MDHPRPWMKFVDVKDLGAEARFDDMDVLSSDGENLGRLDGFIIDDTKTPYPINADGDSVNLYGYVSMAVAAIQTQSREIEALRAEVAHLRRAQSIRGPSRAAEARRR